MGPSWIRKYYTISPLSVGEQRRENIDIEVESNEVKNSVVRAPQRIWTLGNRRSLGGYGLHRLAVEAVESRFLVEEYPCRHQEEESRDQCLVAGET